MSKLGPDLREGYKKIGIIEGYDKWSKTYDKETNPLIVIEEKITLNLIGDTRNQRVLDLGCGTGRYCVLLAKQGAKVVGVDLSSEMIECARRKVTSRCQFELRLGKIEEMGFPDEHFDVVVSALTLSHVPELETTMREIDRVLKAKGRLIISDIHPYWAVSGHDYSEFFDETGQEYRIPGYPHLFEEYWNLFRKFGLELEDIREPIVDDKFIESFPSLKGFKGVPLAVIMKARKRYARRRCC